VCVCVQTSTSVRPPAASVQTVAVRTSWVATNASVTPALNRLRTRRPVKVARRLIHLQRYTLPLSILSSRLLYLSQSVVVIETRRLPWQQCDVEMGDGVQTWMSVVSTMADVAPSVTTRSAVTSAAVSEDIISNQTVTRVKVR